MLVGVAGGGGDRPGKLTPQPTQPRQVTHIRLTWTHIHLRSDFGIVSPAGPCSIASLAPFLLFEDGARWRSRRYLLRRSCRP